jgi:hypothetical protein
MEVKTRNGLIAVGIMGVIGYIAYKKIAPKTSIDSRKVVLKYVDATFGQQQSHADFSKSMTQSYADAWANAIMNGEETFMEGGINHWTCGGSSKKNDTNPCK